MWSLYYDTGAQRVTIFVRSPGDVTKRLDRLIDDIRLRFHGRSAGNIETVSTPSDVLIVAHGHVLRAFAMRWIKRELTEGVSLLLEGQYSSPYGQHVD